MLRDMFEGALRFVSDMDHAQLAALGGAAVVTYAVYRRYTRISLDDIPGPENPSFLHGTLNSTFALILAYVNITGLWGGRVGHLPSWQEAEAGELEKHFFATYGSVVRWKGPLGVCRIPQQPIAVYSPIVVTDRSYTGRPSLDCRP